jgi:hypothetical protein
MIARTNIPSTELSLRLLKLGYPDPVATSAELGLSLPDGCMTWKADGRFCCGYPDTEYQSSPDSEADARALMLIHLIETNQLTFGA